MLTVTATGLTRADMVAEQITLFDDADNNIREKNKKREEAVDKIRQKFGGRSISQGSFIDSDLGIYNSHKGEKRK